MYFVILCIITGVIASVVFVWFQFFYKEKAK